MRSEQSYAPFIQGELCDLCVPDERAIAEGWASWFNEPKLTAWLDQGVFPNYESDQRAFLDKIKNRERFALLICGKGGSPLLGVISLSTIKPKFSAQISLVCVQAGLKSKLIPLEALALVTTHGFEAMGLRRIWAGLAFDGRERLTAWMETIGYYTDGILRDAFFKGRVVSDVISISCLVKDYDSLRSRRGGKLWAGNSSMKKMIAALPKQSMASKVRQSIKDITADCAEVMDASEMDNVLPIRRSI